jgi:hypothetical protein
VVTAALADPLINGMAIRRILPVHESSCRLRKLAPESPGARCGRQAVGAAVVVTATQAPLLGGGELVCMRRGQAVLDALMCFGLPVRALRRTGT